MSRLFDDALSEFLNNDGTPGVTVHPLTEWIWFNTDDDAAAQSMLNLVDKDTTADWWLVQASGNQIGDPIRAYARAGSANSIATTTTGYSLNTWHGASAVFTSDTARSARIDGFSVGNDSGTRNPANVDRTRVGSVGHSSDGGFFSGELKDAAIWNVSLTALNIRTLFRGVNPFAVRPQNRVFFAPLDGLESPEPDYDGQRNLTLTGTAKGSSNPPVELLENYL